MCLIVSHCIAAGENKRMKEKQYVQSVFYLPFSQSTETGQEASEKEEREQKENENKKIPWKRLKNGFIVIFRYLSWEQE